MLSGLQFIFSFLALVATLAAPRAGFAQDGFVFGADNEGVPVKVPGFGKAGPPVGARPELGAEGTADYAPILGVYSIVNPAEDTGGLWAVFGVTRQLCGALHRGEKSLVDAAPKGFKIERADIHALGFEGKGWNKDRFAVTVTGDSELDVAAGHPYWEITYEDNGRLATCSVTLGSFSRREGGAAGKEERERAIPFMYVFVPQMFGSILVEPHNAGAHPLSPGDVLSMVSPCGPDWCRITTSFDFREGFWYATARIRFNLPAAVE